MYLSVLTQAHVYSHRHTHTDNEKNDRWGKGQPELQLYELTTITALTELTRSEQRKITSLYGLQHIKRHTHTHIYTQTHSHTNITSGSQLSGPRESQCHSLWGPVKEKNREIYVKTTFAYRLRVNNQTQTWKKMSCLINPTMKYEFRENRDHPVSRSHFFFLDIYVFSF